MEISIAILRGRPVTSSFSIASLDNATLSPGPISPYILYESIPV